MNMCGLIVNNRETKHRNISVQPYLFHIHNSDQILSFNCTTEIYSYICMFNGRQFWTAGRPVGPQGAVIWPELLISLQLYSSKLIFFFFFADSEIFIYSSLILKPETYLPGIYD